MIHGRPYHPESQGQVENLNKRVKKKLGKIRYAKSDNIVLARIRVDTNGYNF